MGEVCECVCGGLNMVRLVARLTHRFLTKVFSQSTDTQSVEWTWGSIPIMTW